MINRYSFVIIVFVHSIFLFSCKKDIDHPTTPDSSQSRTDEQLIKDSIYYYYKLYSLWEESVPKYDDISKFTDTITSQQNVLNRLKAFTPSYAPYSNYGGQYDRFSYFSDLSTTVGSNAKLKMDNNDGYGLFFQWGAIDSQTAYPFLYMVERGSPADNAGLNRSDMVLNLNGIDTKIVVDCSSGTCNVVDREKYNTILTELRTSLTRASMKIKIQKVNNQTEDHDLSFSTYEIDPLLSDTVFEFANKNVGYVAYSSFEQIENNNANKSNLDRVFDDFASKNVKDLIVDLRYNGGGYVDAAVYFADKIINSSGQNKLMLSYELNTYLSKNKNAASSTFKDVYYAKNNKLELDNVCFIVSNNTASAAEMLINVLKPYMNVKIVAEGTSTFGKPVGFFEQKIMNKVGLWVTSFRLLNANGQSDYWLGLAADKTNVTDYIFTDFAVKEERMIAAALSYAGVVEKASIKATRTVASKSVKSMIVMDEVNRSTAKGALKIQ